MDEPRFARWFGIPEPAEYSQRLESTALLCGGPPGPPVHELADAIAHARITAFRAGVLRAPAAGRCRAVADAWRPLLGMAAGEGLSGSCESATPVTATACDPVARMQGSAARPSSVT
jgi:hypothetical protein